MFFYMSPQFHCLSLEVVNGESRNGDCSESLIKKKMSIWVMVSFF